MVKCPKCGIDVTELHPVPGDLISKLQTLGESSIPAEICAGCLGDYRKMATSTSGGILFAQERAKEQHRLQLWKSRVGLIKKARGLMNKKAYSEAAVSYEKYLKILEIVFQLKKGEKLTPELFKDTARTSELTVVTSVYWDLLRIYDSSEKYGDRQMNAARQLAAFVRFTPIYPDIIKKAEAFVKQAKNPSAVKTFLKESGVSRPRCFIATSAFESPTAPEVLYLQQFRDSRLRNSAFGRRLIATYYRLSPRIAELLDQNSAVKPIVRFILRFMIACIRR
ncbi:MAG: hypothetical protein N2578_01115 [Bdellovibrionaceae bacterium]|nr:hypothetical protein [Pseudobdellovibrionaceae bacterium]